MNKEDRDALHSRKVTRFERFSIFLIVTLSIAALLWIGRGGHRGSQAPTSVVVFRDGKPIAELDLRKNHVFTLPSGEMEVEVNGGGVRVTRSDCPKQLCVRSGWIKEPGEVIVCVPNKILIELRSSEAPRLDAVVR